MREQSLILGEKPVTYSAKGWLQLHPAYEGWKPSEPRSQSIHGLGFVLMAMGLLAAIAAGVRP